MDEIIKGGLWQGGRGDVQEAVQVVDRIVDLTQHRHGPSVEIPADVRRVEFPMRDGPLPDDDTLAEIDELVQSLAKLIRGDESVFVQCASGINRSGLVAALLVRELEDITGEQAIELLEERTSGEILRNQRFRDYVAGLGRP